MQKPAKQEQFSIEGPAGSLECLLEAPADTVTRGAAVVCHPHPVHGGTLQNKVAHTLARGFLNSGFHALRFNFRGVGKSEGSFDDGEGEVGDVLAAVDWLRRSSPGVPLWLSGFSFGAAMAVKAAIRQPPAGLISVAPAVARFADNLDAQPQCPWLIVQGDEDELVDIDATLEWVNSLQPGPEVAVIAGAEHFFHGKLVQLRDTVEAFVASTAEKG